MDKLLNSIVATVFLILIAIAPANANLQTPGAIQYLPQITGFTFRYEPIFDVAEFSKPDGTKISISVLPAFDSAQSLVTILHRMKANQYRAAIKTSRLAGHRVATVSATLQTQHWWLVVERDDLNLFIRAEATTNPQQLKVEIEKIIGSVRISEAVYPPNVAGHYNTGSHYSGSYDSSFGVYSESGITLETDGSIRSSSHTGISGTNTTGLSQSDNSKGWWQVRGNRLLGFRPPDQFHNFRYGAFSNGLEIHTGYNKKLLWVRQ